MTDQGEVSMNTTTSAANRLIEIGIALSAEKDTTVLMERILLEAMDIAQADGGTLYLRDEDHLKFEIVRTHSLEIAQGGSAGSEVTLPPMAMKMQRVNRIIATSSPMRRMRARRSIFQMCTSPRTLTFQGRKSLMRLSALKAFVQRRF